MEHNSIVSLLLSVTRSWTACLAMHRFAFLVQQGPESATDVCRLSVTIFAMIVIPCLINQGILTLSFGNHVLLTQSTDKLKWTKV